MKPVQIALIIDDRLTRDRRGTLSRVVVALRQSATVQIMSGEIAQADLVQKLQAQRFDLVLAPWYRYREWSKVEAFFGLTRSSGPTFAGYVCDPIDPHEIGAQADHLRTMVFDFADTLPHEVARLVAALARDTQRTGVRPLLDAGTAVYCENWFGAQGSGWRTDTVLALPEIAKTEWASRGPAIRLLLGALWSLVYDEGSGKSELSAAINGGKTPRAYFNLGADGQALVMRLWYLSPGINAKNALRAFWPDPTQPTSAAQLLHKHADFLRVHTLSEGQDVEVTVGLFKSAPAQNAHRRLHSFWIEPISTSLVSEPPFESPGPDKGHLKALPAAPSADKTPRGYTEMEEALKSKERFIFESAVKIRELKKQVAERDELIQELRSGGVGTAQPLAPPDAEGLLEAFNEKCLDAGHQIQQFEQEIARMESEGATPQEIEALRLKMAALTQRSHDWIRKVAAAIEAVRAAKKAVG